MNVQYLNSLPKDISLRKKGLGPIQLLLDEFMKTNAPVMEVSVATHYKSIDTARTTWLKTIKNSGYSLRIYISKDKGALYIVKVDPDIAK